MTNQGLWSAFQGGQLLAVRLFDSEPSGVHKGGFSKGGFSNNMIKKTHKLLNPPLLNPPL